MFTLERLSEVAQSVSTHQTARDAVCDAVWALYGDDAQLSDHLDDLYVEDGYTRLHYVLPEEEGGITILTWEDRNGTNVIVDRIDNAVVRMNLAYAEKHDGQVCPHCHEMCHKECVECPHCGKFIDTDEKVPELAVPNSQCLEDGGSDRYVWVMNERLPTHETKSNHTYVFIVLDLMPQEGRYRGTFDKPEEWCCSVCTVNVGMAGKKGAAKARKSYGMDEETWDKLPHVGKAQVLLGYGLRATLKQECGYSAARLLQKAVAEWLPEVDMFCGFMLDAPQNAIGNSGWDFMKGDIGFR